MRHDIIVRAIRLIRRVVLAVLVLAILVMAAIGGGLYATLPADRERAAIAGLSEPAEIGIDGDGVPHIHAATGPDAAAALGFVHARDRLFEMDMMRRVASGHLSEVIGRYGLRYDRAVRVLGLRRAAEAEWATMPAEPRAMLEAYARGVNAWIEAHGRLSAPQFVVLGTPEPWTPVDSLLWGETMGLYLSGNWQTELTRARLLDHVSRERIDALWPPQPGISPSAGGSPRYAGLAGWIDDALPHFPAPFTLPDSASNEWAVDGAHSRSGAPLLAGDPHLAFTNPSLWYLARIDTPDGTLAGATAPGVPFLLIGHNSHIAWTITTAGADTQDLFEETVLADGRYQTPTGPADFVLREERIHVRFADDVVLQVRETRHGPVINEIADVDANGPVYAASMANLSPGAAAADGLWRLNQARDVASAGRAAAAITSSVQNLLVADAKGIGQFTIGRVPIRRAGDGAWPQAGADGLHDWTGWASGDALPHLVNPASGRIVNANDRTAPPDFPVFMGRDWFGTWRADRIRTLLGDGMHDAEDFALMQVDVTDTFAQTILPVLRAVPRGRDLAGRAAALLDGWGGVMAMDLPQPLIFDAWVRQFEREALERYGIPPGSARAWTDFVAWVLSPAGAAWCGGDCTQALGDALQHATAALATTYGSDPAAWRWGRAHEAVFADALLPFMSARIAQPGDDTTIFRGGSPLYGFRSVHGPGMRGVFDLADLDASRFIIAPGQSSHPLSQHLRDMLLAWRNGGTVQLRPRPARIDAILRLDPSGG